MAEQSILASDVTKKKKLKHLNKTSWCILQKELLNLLLVFVHATLVPSFGKKKNGMSKDLKESNDNGKLV